MSKTYRLWRRRTLVEYRDIEANSKKEAGEHSNFTSPREEWTVTDNGMITDFVVRTPNSKRQGEAMYLQMRVNEATYNAKQLSKELEL